MIHRVRRFLSQTLSYNILSLPCSISTSSDEADYSYLSDGTKAQVLGEQNEDGYAYLGSMVFALREGEWLFDSTPFAGGMIRRVGARLYDDRLCRWTTRDPMSEKYYGFSPYNYCAGDPVSFQDPDGMDRQIKTRQNTKVISARFYVDHSKYHGINTYDAIAKAALFLNNAKGLKYSKDGETHPVSFDITVMR